MNPVKVLARARVPLGFLFAAIVLWLAQPTATSLAVGTLVAAAGESLRVWAAGHLNKSREVTVSGPYRFFAHPLYVGSSIMGVGVALAANRAVVVLCVAVYLLVTIGAAIKSEEAYLRGKFGDEYEAWRRGRVGTRRDEERRRRFSLAQAIANREYRALGGLMVAVLLLALKATYNGTFWRAGAGH